MNRRPVIALAGLTVTFVLAFLASGCGAAGDMFDISDMRGMHEQMHGGFDRAPQTPVVAQTAQVTVEIRDFDFFPRDLTIDAGAEVTWVNFDSAPHDATDEGAAWGTGTLGKDERATLTFDTPGTYRYLCTIHPNMRATLTVLGRS